MMRIGMFLLASALLLGSCGGEQKATIEENLATYEANPTAETGLDVLEQYLDAIKADPTNEANKLYLNKAVQIAVDQKLTEPYISAIEVFTSNNPDDPKTPEYLYNGAEVAKYVGNTNKSIEFYDEIYNKYPNHSKAPISLFLKALAYDDDLNDIPTARKLYEEFLDKYPDNSFADDAQLLLNNLGRTDEEILEEIMKMNERKENNEQ